MASLPTALTLLVSLLLSGSFFAVHVNGDGGAFDPLSVVTEQPEFDYFTFVVQWPATYCAQSTKCCNQNACCGGENSTLPIFTLHGLWPDYNNGSWPSCCSGPAFNITEISGLIGVLDQYMLTLSCSKSSTCHKKKGSFWAHEWEQHGTCASSVTGDEYNYFLTALTLYFKYNVTEVIFEAGYVPSNSEQYPSSGIIAAIENAFDATPQLICSNGALKDVYLCLTKDFKFRECPASSKICPEYVTIPEFTPRGITKSADRLILGIESS